MSMFFAPAMLAGLVAIALPIWLHRMARANPTRHPFASLMFLEPSETQRTAKHTIRYWLLLALRVAFLALLVLAFAGPLLPPRTSADATAAARLHAIVIDRSLSMRYGDRWQRALEAAEAVIAAARPGDQLTLIAASGRKVEVLHDHLAVRDAGVVRASLQQLRPGLERLDYGLLMTTASGWLTTPRLPTQLHLISDLQQSASPLRFADLQPPAATQVQIHDVGSAQGANTYIEDLKLSADLRSVTAKVAAGATPTLRQDVVLSIDGAQIARKPLEFAQFEGPAIPTPTLLEGEGAPVTTSALTKRREVDVQFSAPELSEGAHQLVLALDPVDGLPEDDRLYAMIEQAKPRVLLVSRAANSDAAAYFEAAIGSLAAPRLDVERQPADALTARRLSRAALVVESDVSALSSDALAALDEYVAGGGSVLMTLASGSAARQTRLLAGLRIGDVVTTPTQIGQVQASHPVLRNSGDWHRVRFFRHLRVSAAPDDEVLVTLEDGAPLLIERRLGAGRLLLLTAPLERTWNDLAIHPLFIRFIADASRYLIRQSAAQRAAQVGEPAMTGLTAGAGGQIFDPQGQRVLALGDEASADRFVPAQAGFYEVRSNAGQKWLAVNLDRRESQLERMSPSSLQRWLALRPDAPASASVGSNADPLAEHSVVQTSLGYLLLVMAALLCAAELLAANHYLSVRRDARTVP